MRKTDFIKSFSNLVQEVKEIKEMQNKTLQFLETKNHNSNSRSQNEVEWITVKEACKILNCSEVTLWKLRRSNLIPFSKLNRTIRFKKLDVHNYLNQSK